MLYCVLCMFIRPHTVDVSVCIHTVDVVLVISVQDKLDSF